MGSWVGGRGAGDKVGGFPVNVCTLVAASAVAALCAAGPALAQDASERPFNGFYLGVHGGGLTTDYFGEFDSAEPASTLSFEDLDSFQPLLGFQLGVDRHITERFVIGVQIDMSFAFGDSEGSRNGEGDFLTAETDYLATAGIRAGYEVVEDTLLYGRAGVAFVNYDGTATDAASGVTADIGEGNAGVFAAGGLQYKLTESVSIQGEGVYYFFDDENEIDGVTPDSDVGDRFAIDGATLFRLGLSYHF